MTVEIKLDSFVFENPVTVDVSCDTEIYFAVPSPAMVDVNADPAVRFDVVDVSWLREMYPAVPNPVTVDTRLRVEM